tara:strand:- start:946 stop:1710 length:765 start_codon:yes stop_codon:yes gene_type:complete
MNKKTQYQLLVQKRKSCFDCKELTGGFVNQSCTDFDTNEIGNFSMWANNLDAEVVIIGQDCSNQETFNNDEGEIQPINDKWKNGDEINKYATITNYYLRELTKELGLDLGLPTEQSNNKIFLTNAVLCLKNGGMNASIPKGVYKTCGENFLKPLIEIIKPKAIITLGKTATEALILAFNDKINNSKEISKKSFKEIFKTGKFKIEGQNIYVFPVYHPGRFGQMNRKKGVNTDGTGFDLQKEDWKVIKGFISYKN